MKTNRHSPESPRHAMRAGTSGPFGWKGYLMFTGFEPGTRVIVSPRDGLHSGGTGTVVRAGTWNDSAARPTPGYFTVRLDSDADWRTGNWPARSVRSVDIATL